MLKDDGINAIYARETYTEPFSEALSNPLEWETDNGGPPVKLPDTLNGYTKWLRGHTEWLPAP